ncbi:MerR family transcriptional regulator [Streptomyces sp. NPDC088131]|uniref:MerR family transcriptional regulator n=1 Tax=Streptomyces sp. NPDC088131 TaxID=3365826 RepID=UPI0037FAA1B5
MVSSTERAQAGTTAQGQTTGTVARRLGVAPTTLRTWDRRYGIGPARRQGGRHRRWTAEDIAVLAHMCDLTGSGVPPAEAARTALNAAPGARTRAAAHHPVPPALPPRPASSRAGPDELAPDAARHERRGLMSAALRLDARTIDDRLTSAIGRYGPVAAWDQVIMPTLHAVGRKWQTSGEKYVEVEHLLSWHVSSALRRVTVPPATADDGTGLALLACTPGETHTLPLEALAACLTERGLGVRMFGASVPGEALTEAVRRTGPSAVVLWSQSRNTAARPLAHHVASSERGVRGARTRPAVLIAGPGWAGPPMPGTHRPRELAEAIRMLTGLCAR